MSVPMIDVSARRMNRMMASLTDSKNFQNDFMAAPVGRLPVPGLKAY
jgi:hypothetical protein